ncbi:hypothetical protein [Sphingobacterium multivorum]|uniref:hypothetical protein n=1 Tax=Sphingobacterium multivorum TaxID=28454 RepID=UPI0031BA64CE
MAYLLEVNCGFLVGFYFPFYHNLIVVIKNDELRKLEEWRIGGKTNKANPKAPLVVPLSTSMIKTMVPRRLTRESPYWIYIFKDKKFQ